MAKNLFELLSENRYPGRGIMLGAAPDGCAVAAYFIMGRSENSRNRLFAEKEGGIVTEAADPARVIDPSLIIYAPVRLIGGDTIVTNGDQTDTIYDAIARGQAFEPALRTRTFEPDPPNYTPRISGIIGGREGFSYRLSIIKTADGNPSSVERFFYCYPQPIRGRGHFISTYAGDGDPLPSFCGEPEAVELTEPFESFCDRLWNSLDAENKVSLFVRRIERGGGETRIYNKYSRAPALSAGEAADTDKL
jgi:IMP cyclohydrolase